MMRLSVIVFLFGMSIVPGWLLYARFGRDLSRVEFPLGDVSDVAVDSAGHIYVAENFHHRVQRCSPDGKFELGWFVPTGGFYGLRTTADDRVEVATARANKFITYSRDGRLLTLNAWQKQDRAQEFASETQTTGGYIVRGGLIPRIVDGKTGRLVIATPWRMRLISAPFPAMAYSLVGVAMLGLAEWRKRRREIRESGGSRVIRRWMIRPSGRHDID
jgi:hypothetical protein